MTTLSTTELSRMRDAAEVTMYDTCVLMQYLANEVDEHNRPKPNWQDRVDSYACGFKIVKNREVMVDAEVVWIDAELRLPYDAPIDRRDKVRITHRLGEFIIADRQPVFLLVGEPVHGHNAIVVPLIRDVGVS